MQVKHAIGVSSGTDALTLALHAAGVGAGDEVITTPYTFFATAEPVTYFQAKPVFVDVEADTLNISPNAIEAAITPRTKVIIPVHLFGQPADMDAIMAIAEAHNLVVIEDAAQAHGAEVAGKRVGNHGHMATYSFYPSKNLGAYGDAGMLTTNDDHYGELLRKLRNHGRVAKYEHDMIGYGARLDALQAAILGVKLRYLEEWTEARRKLVERYNAAFANVDGIIPLDERENLRHVYHMYVVRVPGKRNALLSRLKEDKIGSGVYYPIPNHLQPAFRYLEYEPGDLPISEQAAAETLALPLYAEMTDEQQERVIETVLKTLQ